MATAVQWLGNSLFALALMLPLVLLVLQRRRLRPLEGAARAGATLATVLAVPTALAGHRFISEELTGAVELTGLFGVTLVLLAPVLAFVLLVLLGLQLRGRPGTPFWPLVAFALYFLGRRIDGSRGGDFDGGALVAGVGLLGLAALAAPAAAAALNPLRLPRALSVLVPLVPLLLLLPMSAITVLSSATDGGGPGYAEHAWSAAFDPEDEEEYVLHVPFLVPEGERAGEPLQRLRDELEVEGDATARFMEDGAALEVRGRGPVRVSATLGFFGDTGAREAFTSYRVPPTPALLENGTMERGRLTWSAIFSGGSGHTCRASAQVAVELRAGEPQPLPYENGLSERGHVQALCA